MPVIETTDRLKSAVGVYDFAVDGGAQGVITLRGGGTFGGVIPAGSVVHSGYIDVTTATAGTGTVSVDVEAAGDTRAAATIAAAGRIQLTPGAKTTVPRNIRITIGTANVTQGAFTVVVFYR